MFKEGRRALVIWLIGGAVIFVLLVASVRLPPPFSWPAEGLTLAIGGAAAIIVILLLAGSPILLGYVGWRGGRASWRRLRHR